MIFDFGPTPYVQSPLESAPPVPGTSVLLAFGQSNMVDQSGDDGAVPWPANAQLLDPQTLTYAVAAAPVKWLESIPNISSNWQNGPGQLVKHFAIDWCAAHPNDTLIVVPAARGGTGFQGEWIADGNGRLYNEMIRLLDQVFADHPNADFLAMLAQHGEADGADGNRVYQWCATEMITKIRDRYNAPKLPVVWGEPGPVTQFGTTAGAGYDAVRAQIRALPTQLSYVATVREEDSTTFDALTALDGLHFNQASQKVLGDLHYAALTTAQGHTEANLPDVALIWQTVGEHGWLSYDIPAMDLEAGDTLVVLAAGHRSSGQPFIDAATLGGESAAVHLQELSVLARRIGLSVASVTLSAAPTGGTIPIALTWRSIPAGGGVSIWRVKGGITLTPGSFGHDANLGPLAVDLTAGLPGMALTLAYAVDTAQNITFSGNGTFVVEGPCNTNAAYFTSRHSTHAGGTATLMLTPSATPDRVCGMVAVAVG